jgi:hypothetical protein
MTLSPDVASLLDYFFVAKGDSDWRMVYNGTSCGLNARLWAPNFWLPNASSALRVLDHHYYSVDLDHGEMFLNFPAHSSFETVSGVDLSFFRHASELLAAVQENACFSNGTGHGWAASLAPTGPSDSITSPKSSVGDHQMIQIVPCAGTTSI